MKKCFLFFFLALLLTACKDQPVHEIDDQTVISSAVSYQFSEKSLELHSGKFTYRLKKEDLPLQRVVLLNSSLTGYLEALGLEDRIVGVTSPQFIYAKRIIQGIEEGKIAVVGNEEKYDVEQILALKPDAVFSNYLPNFENSYEILRNNGIPVIFLDEYLEKIPLEKSAYLKVFGALFGVERQANDLYTMVEEHYKELQAEVAKATEQPLILCNEMYGNQWFLPGTDSFVVRMFADAKAHYPWASEIKGSSAPLSFEEVYSKAGNAQYWVNLTDYKSKKEMLVFNPVYAELEVFKKGKLYTVGGRKRDQANDYFSSGMVRADLILQDYINIFHPHLLKDSTLVYMKELKD